MTIAEETKNTIDYAKIAADNNPNNIIFQHKIADVYAMAARDIGIVGADEWAVKKYKRAIELEPTNPILLTSLGKIYVWNYFTTKSEEVIDQAIIELEKALKLKSNLETGLQLSVAYESKGDDKKAIEALSPFGSLDRIENLIVANRIVSPLNSGNIDIDIAFQLGKLYYNTDKIGKAKDIFSSIVKISPKNSNAHYSLGLIYEKEKNYKEALVEFEIVLLLNPENEDIKNKVKEIEKLVNKKAEPENENENENE